MEEKERKETPDPVLFSSRVSRHSNDSETSTLRSLRGRRQEEEQTALQQLLDYLQRILQRSGSSTLPYTRDFSAVLIHWPCNHWRVNTQTP